MMPKWIEESLSNIASDNDYEATCLKEALEIAWETLQEYSRIGEGSNEEPAQEALRRIASLGDGE